MVMNSGMDWNWLKKWTLSIRKMVWHVFAPFSTRISSHSRVYQLWLSTGIAIYSLEYHKTRLTKKTHQFKLLCFPWKITNQLETTGDELPRPIEKLCKTYLVMEPCYPSSHNPWATSEKMGLSPIAETLFKYRKMFHWTIMAKRVPNGSTSTFLSI